MASADTICEHTELDRLIRSDAVALAQWLALPRRQFAAKEVLHAAGDTQASSWPRGVSQRYTLRSVTPRR